MSKLFSKILFSLFLLFQTTSLALDDDQESIEATQTEEHENISEAQREAQEAEEAELRESGIQAEPVEEEPVEEEPIEE